MLFMITYPDPGADENFHYANISTIQGNKKWNPKRLKHIRCTSVTKAASISILVYRERASRRSGRRDAAKGERDAVLIDKYTAVVSQKSAFT
jgi:hypothetical protein